MNRILGAALFVSPILFGTAARASAITASTFTYQGRLQHNGQPVTGACDFFFGLFDASSGGTQIASQDLNAVPVTDGLFTAALDFGADAFNGAPRWLETNVQCDADEGTWTLAPRQPITVAPVALSARNLTTDASPQLEGDGNAADPLGGVLSVINHGSGPGVRAKADNDAGMVGLGSAGPGVSGISSTGPGLSGSSTHGSGVYGFGYDTDAVGVTGQGNNGAPAMKAIGNAVQDSASNGWAKAMLLVEVSATMALCYNGVTGATFRGPGSTSTACGFTVGHVPTNGADGYHFTVDFGFDVRNRFVSITQVADIGGPLNNIISAIPDSKNHNQMNVYVREMPEDAVNEASFYLILF